MEITASQAICGHDPTSNTLQLRNPQSVTVLHRFSPNYIHQYSFEHKSVLGLIVCILTLK